MNKKAIILLSGGLDSSTVLAVASDMNYDLYAMSFTYGQKHNLEINAAKRVAEKFNVKNHLILDLPINTIGGSALTEDLEIPKDREHILESGIPITYVPARNLIFLSYALSWAEVLYATEIFIGVSHVDYSGYPDCRPEFIENFEKIANSSTKLATELNKKITIHAPLMELNKAETIKLGLKLGVDYSLTHTCYDPLSDGRSCGHCDACKLRIAGFKAIGMADPIEYAE